MRKPENLTFGEIRTGTHGKGRKMRRNVNLVDVQAEFRLHCSPHESVAGKLVQDKKGLWHFEPASYKISPVVPNQDLAIVKARVSRKTRAICAAEAEHMEIGLHFEREAVDRSRMAWAKAMQERGHLVL